MYMCPLHPEAPSHLPLHPMPQVVLHSFSCTVQMLALVPPNFLEYGSHKLGASLVAQMVKRLPAMQETRVQSLGQEDLLQKGVATHSSILE